ncbi:GIP, partial [Symbiodinium necroappetens]
EPRGVDHEAGGTFTERGVEGQSQPKVVADEDAMVGHLHLLVQGMRQLQQLQISKKDTPETETMKGNIELPPMPELGDAAVEFNDWLYVAEQMLGALTDSASVWLSESLRCAREAYDRYQRASAMDRLTITPALTATLLDKRWYRLERRVLTLLLAAMPKGVKEDTITHRVENVTSVLYRLHVLYQPGGAVERTSILGHLEGSSGTEDPTEVVTRLRKWRRYLARAGEMGIVAPDASILLKGLDLILRGVLGWFSDVKFRLDLAHNDLRLSSAPTQESVLKYYQHALAELQQMAPSPKRNGRFIIYAFFAGKNKGRRESRDAGHVGRLHTDKVNVPPPEDKASTVDNKDATPTPSTTTSAASTTNVDSAAAHREEMRQLLQEANSMLSKIKLMGMKVEGVSRTAEDLELLSRANGMVEQGMALLDSGASHPFRNAVDERELLQASDVNVELADGQTVGLLQTKSGTLLNDKDPSQSPIVPLGSLVQQLGCTVSWSKRQGMKIHHPAHGDLTVKMKGNCPMIDELQALKLISEIEEKNLSRLREETAKSLWSQCTTMGSTWEVSLDNFVVTGERSQALAAMMDKNFPLSLETASERFSMVGPNSLDLSEAAGLNYLKALPVNRKMRRRLHSTRWIVHLYDGKNPTTTAQLKQLEDESTTLIEIDLQRSKVYDMKGWSNIFRALLWAACRGQIGGIVGGPPRDDRDELKRKMMYLWMVADRGASKEEYQLFNARVVSAIKEAVQQWIKHPDQLRMAQLLCAMNGKLEDMSEAELKRPHRRVLNPSAFTLGVDIAGPPRTKGVDADGKYRYALVGSYCLPKVEGFKDMDIPEVFEDEGAGVGEIMNEDADFLEEERIDEPPNTVEDQHDMDYRNEEYKKFYKESMRRLKTDVNAAMRRMYLSVRQDGHPIVRVHSDRARELKSASLRQWLYEKDIWVTTGEAQTPQQNGRAEAAVKLLKKYTKVLLGSSGLPRECWPLAMSYAAYRQRQRAMGQPCKDPPFGTKVAVKSKVFGTGGSYDLDPRWREGKFVGRSSDVTNGLVVRYEDGSFVTSCHVRPGLVDAEAAVDPEPVELELPIPRRRLCEKARLAFIRSTYHEVEELAREMTLEEKFSEDDVVNLWSMLKEIPRPRRRGMKMMDSDPNGESFYSGGYVHGGVCGVLKMAKHLPQTTAYLVKAAKKLTGRDEFGCVAIVEDVGMGVHRDSHNEKATQNSVTALTNFNGGQVWVEKGEDEFEYDDEWKAVRPNLWVRGSLHDLEKGRTVFFPPGQWHSTNTWEGRRIVLLTYTPRLTNLTAKDAKELQDLGFSLPGRLSPENGGPKVELKAITSDDDDPHRSMFDGPVIEFDGDNGVEEWASTISGLLEDQQDMIEELQDRSLVLRRLLEEEEILLEEYRRRGYQVNQEADHAHQMLVDLIEQTGDTVKQLEDEQEHKQLKAMLQAQDCDAPEDVERHLQELQEDLQVVLTVPLEQVKRHLPLWFPAIDKELSSLFKDGKDGTLQRIPLNEAKEREAKGELTILPSKLVFTVKPPAQGALPTLDSKEASRSKGKERWRRKCRLVLCGNFAERPEGQAQSELYASGATSESLRVALTIAACCSWAGAGSDITGAFLLAPWPKHMRRYAIILARTLVLAGRASSEEAWEVHRALYGLRESPAVWSEHRRQRLLQADIPWQGGKILLKPSVVDPEVWMIIYREEEKQDTLVGVLVTYVDDLLYLAEPDVINTVHSWLSEEWPSSPLEWTSDGTRYLGVEILQNQEGAFLISQRGYLENLVRSYDLEPGAHPRLPCPREWLVDEDSIVEDEQYDEAEMKKAQKVTGELLRVTRQLRLPFFFKELRPWYRRYQVETSKERRLRRLREVARSAAEEELDKQQLKKELEVEAESLRRVLKAETKETLCDATTQTPPMPEPRVEVRTVYRDRPAFVPDDVPVTHFWKTTDH